MVHGIPLQTSSGIKSIRGFGCYLSCLAAIAMDVAGTVLSVKEIEAVFAEAVKLGIVLDNDVPTTEAGWWRCFVMDPWALMRLFAQRLGYRAKVDGGSKETVSPTPAGWYTIVEYTTGTGSHFRVGTVAADKSIVVEYDPGPSFPVNAVRTVRHWRVWK